MLCVYHSECFLFNSILSENFVPWILTPFLKSGKKEAIVALWLHWKPLYFIKKASQDNYLTFFVTKNWKLNAITHCHKCNVCGKCGESYVKIYFKFWGRYKMYRCTKVFLPLIILEFSLLHCELPQSVEVQLQVPCEK